VGGGHLRPGGQGVGGLQPAAELAHIRAVLPHGAGGEAGLELEVVGEGGDQIRWHGGLLQVPPLGAAWGRLFGKYQFGEYGMRPNESRANAVQEGLSGLPVASGGEGATGILLAKDCIGSSNNSMKPSNTERRVAVNQ